LGGTVLLGEAATPDCLLARVLPTAGVIHLACHGFCDAVSPLTGGLLLEPDRRHPDGQLLLYETLGVPVRATVVNAAACYTARSQGPSSVPESLAHTLLGAGARFVIASLWAANDKECLRFAADFYTGLRQAGDPVRAFRQAQQQQLARLRSGLKAESSTLGGKDLFRVANFVLLGARRTAASVS
jgi:CHAT domain-containing protein